MLSNFIFLQLSVIVSLEVAVSQVELAIVDKDQGVATKSVRCALIRY